MRLGYIFFVAMLLMSIGIFVTMHAHYPVYASAAGEFVPALTAICDQQLAGGVLKIIQLTSYTIALFKIVMLWGKKEEEKVGEGALDENLRIIQGIPVRISNHN